MFIIACFWQENLKALVRFCHVNCLKEWDKNDLISIVE